MFGGLAAAYWIYVDFDYHRRIHWIISNLVRDLTDNTTVFDVVFSSENYGESYSSVGLRKYVL